MDSHITIRPDAMRQFGGGPDDVFVLVTDLDLAAVTTVEPSGYGRTEVVAVEPGADLRELVRGLPAAANVLVASRNTFVRSADLAELGARRMSVLPCGSTPVTTDQMRYFLGVLERADPHAQVAVADKFLDAVSEADVLRLVDRGQHTECSFDPGDADYVWNQQAGPLEPGEHQIAPAGELSVLPMEITEFDSSRTLAMDGTLALRGEPIVHAGYDADPALAREQARLYERLTALRRHPVVIEVAAGVITGCRAGNPTPEAARVTRTLNELFDEDTRYRTVWELGFGINTEMSVVAANCGMNEVFGGTNGVVHLGLGLTPFTRFALTFLCPDTAVLDGVGATLLGSTSDQPATGSRRRLRRTKDASCGCH